VVFGWLSDRIGRKKLMMWGCALAAVSYLPIYKLMQVAAGNNVVGVGSESNPVTGEIKLLPQALVDGQKVFLEGTAANPNVAALIGLVFIQVVFVTMVYGPIAAYLVEAFPAKVRYTSMSLPYHIGNGVFGGLLPVIGLAVCAATGSIYAGLAYPIIVALITVVVGTKFLPETKHVRIWDEVHAPTPDAPVHAAVDEPVPEKVELLTTSAGE
jgi:MFS family permease